MRNFYFLLFFFLCWLKNEDLEKKSEGRRSALFTIFFLHIWINWPRWKQTRQLSQLFTKCLCHPTMLCHYILCTFSPPLSLSRAEGNITICFIISAKRLNHLTTSEEDTHTHVFYTLSRRVRQRRRVHARVSIQQVALRVHPVRVYVCCCEAMLESRSLSLAAKV